MRKFATLAGFLSLAPPLPAEAQQNVATGQERRTSVAPEDMRVVAPALAGYTDQILFGDNWERPELAKRDRSLITVAALIAGGKTAQMPGHLGRALDNGVTPAEISGLITHLAFYTGWPNAVSATSVARDVFTKRGIDLAALQTGSATQPPAGAARRTATDMLGKGVAAFAPALAGYTDATIFGSLWQRGDLRPRDRSLVTIAALIATGDTEQLRPYLAFGLDCGLTRTELAELATHLAFYVGWPRATTAAAIARDVVADREKGTAPAGLDIVRASTTASRAGPAENFTGPVQVSGPFRGTAPSLVGGATVRFQPGARTAWHSHPLGQTLVVTSGTGWVQVKGGPIREIRAGDVVVIAPGVLHWHGATATTPMTHVAIAEASGGTSVHWDRHVADEDYAKGPPAKGAE
ncbi:cupin domain-containing protein [Sphingomonas sp. TF3]|uniref:(R)-mandelonitrile lyase n=1 Tax=Sphingomonas sp. TF3 TaxID=2495580 RepID=UPI000F88D445|nr:carboxymuconolactone decarboxylase family protein [Sphingomonas sp. TF3]RUN78321.1 cupin domain-containing protein [Sphingomonas sp. TF3]